VTPIYIYNLTPVGMMKVSCIVVFQEYGMCYCFTNALRINLYIPVSNIRNEGTRPYALNYTYSFLALK